MTGEVASKKESTVFQKAAFFLLIVAIPLAVWLSYQTRQQQHLVNQLLSLNQKRLELAHSVALLPTYDRTGLQNTVVLASSFRSELLVLPEQDSAGIDRDAWVSLKLGGTQFADLADTVLAGGFSVAELAQQLEAAYALSNTHAVQPILDKIAAFFFREMFRQNTRAGDVRYYSYLKDLELELASISDHQLQQQIEQLLNLLSPMVSRHNQRYQTSSHVLTHHFNNELPALTRNAQSALKENFFWQWCSFLAIGVALLTLSVTARITHASARSKVSSKTQQTADAISGDTAELNNSGSAGVESASVEDAFMEPATGMNETMAEKIDVLSPIQHDRNLASNRTAARVGSEAERIEPDGILSENAAANVENRDDSQTMTETSAMRGNAQSDSALFQASSHPDTLPILEQDSLPNTRHHDNSAADIAADDIPRHAVNIGHQTTDTTKRFDINLMLDTMDDDIDAVNMLLEVFITEHCHDDKRLKTLLANQEYTAAERIVHSIKSVAGNLGAAELNQTAARLESALKQDEIDSALVEQFSVHLSLLIEEIQLHLALGVTHG
uniref:Hpt domain-containing protein n=1 Tax=Thaumasiovibrio occultus TaxID=1891184 RepID=UPI000B35AB1C|nr:Hpt domain-containing protein [Thaumasiovibrio occultus]